MSSLAEEFPKEINRVRELQKQYLSIGPAVSIGAAMMEAAIRNALNVQAQGDVVQMISSYEELKQFSS